MQSLSLHFLSQDFSVCKLTEPVDCSQIKGICFYAQTDCEHSLVCETSQLPPYCKVHEDGWRAFRICGTLDFSLIGILSRITGFLAEKSIGVFAVSTFDTDYILVRSGDVSLAQGTLFAAGYQFV